MERYEYYDQACSALGVFLRPLLCSVRREIKEKTQEIRLYAGEKPSLRCRGELITLEALPQLSPQVINTVFETMCEYSVYAYRNDIANGFVTLRGGHRAGICGKAVIEDNKVKTFTEITSINIRIASYISGCANGLIKSAFSNSICGLLIAGEPMSGKTTLLRDIAASLSNGIMGKKLSVAVIDERNEIAAVRNGKSQYEAMGRCDIISGCPKSEGIMQAIRTISPDVIICDELSSENDAVTTQKCFNCAVPVIATVHATDIGQLSSRPVTRMLIESGAFEKYVFLEGKTCPGSIREILSAKELDNAISSGNLCVSVDSGCGCRNEAGYRFKNKTA